MDGNPAPTRISKACDNCRRRKVRCDGKIRCGLCEKTNGPCTYREKNRNRPRKTTRPQRPESRSSSVPNITAGTDEVDDVGHVPVPGAEDGATPRVFQSVRAVNGAEHSSESSQLFYGPSSNFAFLQQVHRGVLSHGLLGTVAGDREVQEGGDGLDMFVQRSIFFGLPSQAEKSLAEYPFPQGLTPLTADLPLLRASEFLSAFKVCVSHEYPLFSEPELDLMLHELYDQSRIGVSQKDVLTMALLATGASLTTHTNLAETLYSRAKAEAAKFDEAVTLPMIQFALLMAYYQLSMGRPNSTYLYLGVACRKALAFGLHKETAGLHGAHKDLQSRRATMWSLYFTERWQAHALGRQSALQMSEITCEFPDDQPVLVSRCKLAHIVEVGAAEMYDRRSDSLRLLHAAAEKMYVELQRFSQKYRIATAERHSQDGTVDDVSSFQLHNRESFFADTRPKALSLLTDFGAVYYHAVLLTFRPFLIAEVALRMSGRVEDAEELWLRKACRHAVDAAQDSLTFVASQFRKSDDCKRLRYQAFFTESCCAVLLHDSLWHPSKHPYNLEYIQTAFQTLAQMVDNVPVTLARSSIQRIVHAVELAIGNSDSTSFNTSRSIPAACQNSFQNNSPNVHFPSLHRSSPAGGDNLIHLSDRFNGMPVSPALEPSDFEAFNINISQTTAQASDASSWANYNVLATDLYSFFPLDMLTPQNGLG